MEITVAAVTIWAAPSLMRSFAIQADRVGVIMAAAMMVSDICGPLSGGYLADRFQRAGGPRRTLVLVTILGLLAAPAGLFSLLPKLPAAVVVLVVFMTIATAICIMGTAIFIVVIPEEVRGLGSSMLTTVATVSVGLAPILVSALSSNAGASIQLSLAVVGAGTTLAAAATFAAGIRRIPVRESSSHPAVGQAGWE